MSSDRAFLDAIVSEPDDDTHRLVYADWLEDHGGPDGAARAELIRLQCQLARLEDGDQLFDNGSCSIGVHVASPMGDDFAQMHRLRRRCLQLLDQHAAAWIPECLAPFAAQWFRRGFLEQLSLNGDEVLASADDLFGNHPIRELRINRVGDTLEQLLALPALTRLRSLTLSGHPPTPRDGTRRAGRLADTASLSGLRELCLPYTSIGTEGLRHLVESPHLSGLERVNFYCCHFDEESCRVLAEAKHWDRLTGLGIGGNYLNGAEGLAHLAPAPHLGRLRVLNLWGVLSDMAAQVLAQAKAWPLLRVLDVYGSPLTERGVRELCDAESFPELRVLEAGQTKLKSRGVEILAGSAAFSNLRFLGLMACDVGSPGLKALAESQYLGNLEVLDLNSNRIGTPGVRALTRSNRLPHLAWLGLAENNLGDDAARLLAASKQFPSLVQMDLCYNPITDEGADHFCETPGRGYSVDLAETEVSSRLRSRLEEA